MESEARPFGGWAPTLSGIIPSAPPPALVEPAQQQEIFNYESLKQYRLVSQPYIVRATYDMVQEMLEDRIALQEEMRFQAWLQWVAANL